MVVEVNLPPLAAASQTSSNSSTRDLGTHDRFVGRAQRREHPRQALLLFVSPGLFVGAIEIIECERDIFRETLQERDQFGR